MVKLPVEFYSKHLKPKIYKNSLYIGKRHIYKFTKDYTRKFLFKTIWIGLLIIMVSTMLIGGLVLLFNNNTTTTQLQVIDLNNFVTK